MSVADALVPLGWGLALAGLFTGAWRLSSRPLTGVPAADRDEVFGTLRYVFARVFVATLLWDASNWLNHSWVLFGCSVLGGAWLALAWWFYGGDDDWRKRRRRFKSWVRSRIPRPTVARIRPVMGAT